MKHKVEDIIKALSNLPEPQYEGQVLRIPIIAMSGVVPVDCDDIGATQHCIEVVAIRFWWGQNLPSSEWFEWHYDV